MGGVMHLGHRTGRRVEMLERLERMEAVRLMERVKLMARMRLTAQVELLERRQVSQIHPGAPQGAPLKLEME